jgi:hypothetical protein
MNPNIRSAAHSARSHSPEWIDTYARIGIASKGAVYVLIGVLAAMAAFGEGGSVNGGQQGAFRWVLQQSFGQILLGLVIIGLLGYVGWRMIMAFKDPDGYGTDAKAIFKRAGFFFSGLTYLFFAFSAARMLLPEVLGSGSGGGGGREMLIAKVLSQPFGQVLVGIFAAIVIGKGLFQFYRGITGKFKGHVNERTMSHKEHEVYTRAGRIGYVARGIVFAILGYFLVKAALESDPGEAGGTGEALSFLSGTGGPYILAAVALGLAAYGIFMFVKSRYRYIPRIQV